MIVPLADARDRARFGGKAAALAEAIAAGLPVPDGIALDPEAAERVAAGARNEAVAAAASCDLGPLLAVRSSATAEDGASASFAGQFTTKLGVTPDGLAAAVAEVLASTAGAEGYRARVGSAAPLRMAVVVQRLVRPDVAGVLFTKNPLTGADERVIEAAYGLGEAVVAGLVTPDTYRVARGGHVLEVRAGYKDLALHPLPGGGTEEVAVAEEEASARALDDAALRRLDALATQCETVFGGPRDIEWAISELRLVLLQCRPVTGGVEKHR